MPGTKILKISMRASSLTSAATLLSNARCKVVPSRGDTGDRIGLTCPTAPLPPRTPGPRIRRPPTGVGGTTEREDRHAGDKRNNHFPYHVPLR
jgi:hypothetical protein